MKRILFLIFILFLPLTIFTPRGDFDDYAYALSWQTFERLTSISDFGESIITHYITRNGRIWTNGLAAIFCSTETDSLFKILNSIVFVAAIYSSVVLLNRIQNKTIRNSHVLFLFLLIWFLLPVPGETLLWLCGSLNYLWPTLFTTLLFLCCYQIIKYPNRKRIFFPYLLGSFFCGSLHESFSFSILGAFIIYYFIKKPSYNQLILYMAIAYALGACVIFFSPGSIHRANISILSTSSIGLAILFRIYTLGILFIGLKLKATMLLCVSLLLLRIFKPTFFKTFCYRYTFFLLVICLGIIFSVLIAYVEERGLMWIEFISIWMLYILGITCGKRWYNDTHYLWRYLIVTIGLLCFAGDYSHAVTSIFRIHHANEKIMHEYKHSKEGIIRSPLVQSDYDCRFIFYFNKVDNIHPITQFYKQEVNKPFRLIPAPYYDAMHGDIDFFTKKYKVSYSKDFYTIPNEKYYIAKVKNTNYPSIQRVYRFSDDFWLKKIFPQVATLIENFYSTTNLQVNFLTVNNQRFVFVNKLKRMIPGLELVKLDFISDE